MHRKPPLPPPLLNVEKTPSPKQEDRHQLKRSQPHHSKMTTAASKSMKNMGESLSLTSCTITTIESEYIYSSENIDPSGSKTKSQLAVPLNQWHLDDIPTESFRLPNLVLPRADLGFRRKDKPPERNHINTVKEVKDERKIQTGRGEWSVRQWEGSWTRELGDIHLCCRF